MRTETPVALDVRTAHRGGVEQQVDEVVVQQVDLVDVEHAAVRVGEEPGLVGPHALGQRPLQVQRADQPVLGGADGQLDQPGGRARPPGAASCGPSGQCGSGAAGSQEKRQPATTDRGQQRGERAHRGGLGRALLPAHQHPADGRVTRR